MKGRSRCPSSPTLKNNLPYERSIRKLKLDLPYCPREPALNVKHLEMDNCEFYRIT